MHALQPTHALTAAALSDKALLNPDQDQLSLHKRQASAWFPVNPWFGVAGLGIPILGGVLAGIWDAFTKRDLESAEKEHWFVFRVNEDDLEMKDVAGLDGLMANFTGDGTAMFGAPGWSHDVKGNWTFRDVATTDGLIRGNFAFFLPKSKLPAQLMTSRSVPEDPKVEAQFLMPMDGPSEETKAAIVKAVDEMSK